MISWIKNLVSVLASPLLVAVVLGVAGAVCRSKANRRLGTVLMLSAVAVAYLGATPGIGNAMLVPLERRYPPLSGDARALNVSDVVVLGSSYSPVGEIPVTGALDETGLVRIVEGVRLTLRLEQRGRLIVSGGAAEERNAPALGYAELARSLGVAEASLVILDDARDTGDEAEAVSALLGTSPFFLVTSAYHMPRAMRLMERAGAHPIPAPTHQRIRGSGGFAWHEWLPSGSGLRRTEEAVHEYLGLLALSFGID
jgi:uncharacterized SAM-binding protein YcdF (DUF218 family)